MRRFGCNCSSRVARICRRACRMRAMIAAIVLSLLADPRRARGTILFAGGGWAAIDRGDGCVALGRSAQGRGQGQGPGDRRLRLHAGPPPLGRVPRAAEPPAARRLERDADRSATSRSCWSRAAAGRGAGARRRSRRSSPPCAVGGGDAGRGARLARRAASPTPMRSTARRPRSTPRAARLRWQNRADIN